MCEQVRVHAQGGVRAGVSELAGDVDVLEAFEISSEAKAWRSECSDSRSPALVMPARLRVGRKSSPTSGIVAKTSRK